MTIIVHFRNPQAVNQILKFASRIPRGITVTRSVPPIYQRTYREFRKTWSKWSKMEDPNKTKVKKSKITLKNGWMALSYSERTGHNTWTPWKTFDTFYTPPEHNPPPLRQSSDSPKRLYKA